MNGLFQNLPVVSLIVFSHFPYFFNMIHIITNDNPNYAVIEPLPYGRDNLNKIKHGNETEPLLLKFFEEQIQLAANQVLSEAVSLSTPPSPVVVNSNEEETDDLIFGSDTLSPATIMKRAAISKLMLYNKLNDRDKAN